MSNATDYRREFYMGSVKKKKKNPIIPVCHAPGEQKLTLNNKRNNISFITLLLILLNSIIISFATQRLIILLLSLLLISKFVIKRSKSHEVTYQVNLCFSLFIVVRSIQQISSLQIFFVTRAKSTFWDQSIKQQFAVKTNERFWHDCVVICCQ